MMLVGLTGGLGTGKSTIARMFAQCGAFVLDADSLARDVVKPGKPAWRDIVQYFGKHVLHPDRSVNRQALAASAFSSVRRLHRLNAIVHPRVAREQARLCRQYAATHPDAVILYDAPLLIEAGAHRRMDRIIVVTADLATQLARAQRRSGLSKREALRRIRAQLPLRAKVSQADYVLDGREPLGQLRRQVRGIYAELHEAARQRADRSVRKVRIGPTGSRRHRPKCETS